MGIILEMFLGLGFILFLPIGMCMLAAYLSRSYIGPRETRLRTDSGFSAFPLYPFRFRLRIPFLKEPTQFFFGLMTLQLNSTPQNLFEGKVLILMDPECIRIQTASLLEVQGSAPKMLLLSSSGLCFLIYSEAMMILTLIIRMILFDWYIYRARVAILRAYKDRCHRRLNHFLFSYPFRDCLLTLSLSMIIFHCCLEASVLFRLLITFMANRDVEDC